MRRRGHQRLFAMMTVFAMLFSHIDYYSFADMGGETAGQPAGPICGMEEHIHTPECYESVLTCGLEESGETERKYQKTFAVHHHTDSCRDEAGNLICGLIENEYYHTHNEFCRDENGNTVCGTEKRVPHVHTEECYQDGVLVCDKPTTTHQHTAACYNDQGRLTCGELEIPTFTSTADNWTEELVSEGHRHSESCYEKRLICGKTEHTHSEACYAQTASTQAEAIAGGSADEAAAPGEADSSEEKQAEGRNEEGLPQGETAEGTEGTQSGEQPSGSISGETTEGTKEEPVEEPAYEPDSEVEDASEDPSEGPSDTELTGQAEAGTPVDPDEENNPSEPAGNPTEENEPGEDIPAPAEQQPAGTTPSEGATTGENPEEGTTADGVATEGTPADGTPTEGTPTEGSPIEGTIIEGTPDEAAPESGNDQEGTDSEGADPEGTISEEASATEEIPVFEVNGYALIRYNGEEETVTIPDGIRIIDSRAFKDNRHIRTAILPDSVEIINNYAFENCTALETVVTGAESRLETIGKGAFRNDRKLDTSFAEQVKFIVENAFECDSEETFTEAETAETTAGKMEEQDGTPAETPIEEPAEEPDEEPAEEHAEEPEKEPEEEPKEDTTEEPEDEPKEEPGEEPVVESIDTTTIPSMEDAPVRVTVTFTRDAGIPEGTELIVADSEEKQNDEGNQETQQKRNSKKANSSMRLNMGRAAAAMEEEPHADIPSLITWQAEEEMPEIVLYSRTLDISLVADGEEIEPDPDAKITVSVTLPGVEDGQQIEVRHITENGSEVLESTNDNGTITFVTDGFSLFSFTSTAQKLSSWTSDLLENTFFGRTASQENAYEAISVENGTEGLDVLEAFSVTGSSDLWMSLRQIKDLMPGKLESVALYTVENGELGAIVKENISLTDILRFNLSDLSSFAIVRDSGLRRRTEELTDVILSGMLPKRATAEATDVTGEFTDLYADEQTVAAYDITIINEGEAYQPENSPVTVTLQNEQIAGALEAGKPLKLWHIIDENTREEITEFTAENGAVTFEASGFSAYVLTYAIEKIITLDGENYKVTVSYGEDAEIPEGAELDIRPVDSADYLEEARAALKWTEADYVFYTKFLDISIVKDGEEVKPQAPVNVSIQLMDVEAGQENLQVVHFGENGAEKVESQATEEAIVTFETPSFSVFGIGNALHEVQEAENALASVKILSFDTPAGPADEQVAATAEETNDPLAAEDDQTVTDEGQNPPAADEAQDESAPETTQNESAQDEQEETITENDQQSESAEEEPAGNDDQQEEVQNTNHGLEEGLELIQTISVNNNKPLWIKAALKMDAALEDMEGVSLYDNRNTPITEDLTTTGQLVTLDADVDSVAVVKDTGYRRLNFVVNIDPDASNDEVTSGAGENGEEAGTNETNYGEEPENGGEASCRIITLNGMMPKAAATDATVKVSDVTVQYAEYEYTVPEEEETEQSEEDTAQEDSTDPAATDEQETLPARTTLAAYDISILRQDAKYQPDEDHPINVEIIDSRITAAEGNIELWHIRDDGTEENIERFTIAEGRIEFIATGFSVYTIVNGKGPSSSAGEREYVDSIDDLTNDKNILNGFYLSYFVKDLKLDNNRHIVTEENADHRKEKFFRNTLNNGKAIVETDPQTYNSTTVPLNSASKWYFDKAGDTGNQFKLYTYNSENKLYIKQDQKSDKQNGLLLTDNKDEGSIFEISFLENPVEVQDISDIDNGTYFANIPKVYIKLSGTEKFLQHSNGGKGIRLYEGKGGNNWNDKPYNNSQIVITCASSVGTPFDDLELDYAKRKKTFGIIFREEDIKGAGLINTTKGSNALQATEIWVQHDVLGQVEEKIITKEADISKWMFEYQDEFNYYITTQQEGVKKYLTLNGTTLTLETTPTANSKIKVESGTGENAGKYRFSVNGYALTIPAGNPTNGFVSSQSGGTYSWLNLVEEDNFLNDDDFQIYTAKKISVSKINNGDDVVIYTRIWNKTAEKYEHYAIDHDGKVFRVYESGDTIQWIGSQVNTALFDFTEYLDNGKPNYFYEFQNLYSEGILSPLMDETGEEVFAADPLGVNLKGRKNGIAYSTITAWDEDAHAYVDLCVNEDKNDEQNYLKLYTRKMDLINPYHFYFATMTETVEESPISTVQTVDSNIYGIKLKMTDFDAANGANRSADQQKYFGGADNNRAGLLSVQLGEDGYPGTNYGTQGSLKGLFDRSNTQIVNHLFIQSTYNNSGYFEYDSTQNYAYLDRSNGDEPYNFIVYDQLASIKNRQHAASSWHGQFFPYNPIVNSETGEPLYEYSDEQVYNKKDILGNDLPDSDPRKGEKLYYITQQDINYFYGMEMEASFTQTESGLDAWGHDIIFEFSGDDDFWLYVDGDLVLDLGGVHSAMKGSVNFRTGKISASGDRIPFFNKSTGKVEYRRTGTLKGVFEANYRVAHPDKTIEEIDEYLSGIFKQNEEGQWIFKDYTTHTMKMFYMERGAGGSNLMMRFNLASVKPGTAILSKELTGVKHPVSNIGDFAFQIWYKKQIGENQYEEAQLIPPEDENTSGTSSGSSADEGNTENLYQMGVYKYETDELARYEEEYEIDGLKYEHVYILSPGEQVEIRMPDQTIEYWVQECGVDQTIFDEVSVNDNVIRGTPAIIRDGDIVIGEHPYRADFITEPQNLVQQPRVPFVNHVDKNAIGELSITKKLFKEDGITSLHYDEDPTTFDFRLYLGTEHDKFSELPAADQIRYYVKYGDYYCKWDRKKKGFVVEEKETAKEEYIDANDLWDDYVIRTSMYGAISKIPTDFTVEIREILRNTKFKVEEREKEIPNGYAWLQYLLEQHPIQSGELPQGSIAGNHNTEVTVQNIRGWGITMNKIWTDESFMEERDPAYFAIFKVKDGADPIYVDGTLKQLPFGDSSLYWYIQTLDKVNGYYFENYKVYEVDVNATAAEHVNSETGVVENYSGKCVPIIPGTENATINYNGRQEWETSDGAFTYKVSYVQGEPGHVTDIMEDEEETENNDESGTDDEPETEVPENNSNVSKNIRVDTVTNSRSGIKLIKQNMSENPLPGAIFELYEIDDGGNAIAGTSREYTSGADGVIAIAYLKEDANYELKEISAPMGYIANSSDPDEASYHAFEKALKLNLNEDVLTIDNYGQNDYIIRNDSLDSDQIGVIIIKNKKFTLQIKKVDQTENPLPDVNFALYRQVNGIFGPRPDYYPIKGYENLLTDSSGFVCVGDTSGGPSRNLKDDFEDGTLKPGTYYLREKGTHKVETSTGQIVEYLPLSGDIEFTVSEAGKVSIARNGQSGLTTSSSIVEGKTITEESQDGISLIKTESSTDVQYEIKVMNYPMGENNTVNIKKVVSNGTQTDNDRTYDFTAKLFLPDGTPWRYTDSNSDNTKIRFTNGVAQFSLQYDSDGTHEEYQKAISVPRGAVLKITESAYNNMTTQYVITPPTGITIPQNHEQKGSECEITIPYTDAEFDVVCTNTRVYTIKVTKKLEDLFEDSGTFKFHGEVEYSGDFENPFEDTSGGEFEIKVTEGEGSVYFQLPVGAKLKVTELLDLEQSDCYEITYNPKVTENDETFSQLIVARTDTEQGIVITNKRKTKDVTVTKTLIDETIQGTKSFDFTVTLQYPDGINPVEEYPIYYTDNNNNTDDIITAKTSDAANAPKAGTAVFSLAPTHGTTGIVSKTFTVPYGSILTVEEIPAEHYSTTINGVEQTGTTIRITEDLTVTTESNKAINFINKREGKRLIVFKTISGPLADMEQRFEFTIKGLEANKEYTYKAYNGTDAYNTEEIKKMTTNPDGELKVELGHEQWIMIEDIPAQSMLTVSEQSQGYVASYAIKPVSITFDEDGTITGIRTTGMPDKHTGSSTNSFRMDSTKKIEFNNDKPAVAPTRYKFHHTPFLLILLFGLILFAGGGLIKNKNRILRGNDAFSERAKEAISAYGDKHSRAAHTSFVRGYVPKQGKDVSIYAGSIPNPTVSTGAERNQKKDSTQYIQKNKNAGMKNKPNLFPRGTPWTGGGSM